MTAPAAPFCTTAEVARLHRQVLKSLSDFADPPNATIPSKTEVTDYIILISNQILMRFRAAGYIIPFVELSGETWPDDQTEYLRLLCVMGSSGIIAGPAVSNPGVRGGRINNVFKQEYLEGLDEIFSRETRIAIPWRAQYYSMTPAEKAVGTPHRPMTDFLEEQFDPGAHYSLRALTDKVRSIHLIFQGLDLDWDYAYDMNNVNRGLPRYIQEV